MFDKIFTALFLTFLGVLISIGSVWMLGEPEPQAPWLSSSAEPTSAWRHTASGWQDSSDWRVGENEARIKFIDRIHPTIVAGLVLLLCLGVGVLFDRKNTDRQSGDANGQQQPDRL